MTDRRIYMNRAAALAAEAAAEGEVPVGAVVVRKKDGLIVGEGRNRRECARNPLAHAELEAISSASRFLGGWRLSGCELYVTLEPCPMCTGGIINSQLDKVVFGAYDAKSGCCGSAADLRTLPGSYSPEVEGGFMEEECTALLKDFFRKMRSKRMNTVKLVKAETDDQLMRISDIAQQIWREYFPFLLSEGQIEYMLEKFCSFEASKENVLNDGYSYYFIKKGGEDIGYTAAKHDSDRLFLSKIYIKKEHRGKKYSRRVIEFYREYALANGLSSAWLTVNKHNDSSIAAYKAMGFEIIGEGVADIGNGYVMDDYYMELKFDRE